MRYLSGPASEVLVDRGLPDPLLPVREGRRKVLVLSQPGTDFLAPAIVDRLDDVEPVVVPVPDRDEAKTLGVLDIVYHRCAEAGIGRHDTILGVGGGATTDLAGFVAATWLRGVESVLLPTTLLGAVDAAIGGKTGINLGGKNMVGAFWPPSRVIVDLDVLDSLPRDIKVEGTAEVYKTGLVGDPAIVDAYRDHGIDAPLELVVPAAIAVKTSVVIEDLRESGRRAILNFGHTIGHAVEFASGLAHGHAVSIGMVAAVTVSERRLGFNHKDEVISDLDALGLPVNAPEVDRDHLMSLVERDKKIDAAGIRMVLLSEIGEPVIDHVTTADIAAGLAAIGIS
ncbi:MAG: 3-dehydroquinate synthase [Acidimicrobiia bacterium]|nr:3-dehydroquinate synthase [Acidimicrobiia bacterium]